MGLLSDLERAAIHAKLMDEGHCPSTVLKSAGRATINAIDDWFDANGPTLNAVFPQPYRSAATTREKSLLLAAVLIKRAARPGG